MVAHTIRVLGRNSISVNSFHVHTVILFFFTYSQPGPSAVVYLYSIHRAVCLSDHSVARPRAEIRTRDGRI